MFVSGLHDISSHDNALKLERSMFNPLNFNGHIRYNDDNVAPKTRVKCSKRP